MTAAEDRLVAEAGGADASPAAARSADIDPWSEEVRGRTDARPVALGPAAEADSLALATDLLGSGAVAASSGSSVWGRLGAMRKFAAPPSKCPGKFEANMRRPFEASIHSSRRVIEEGPGSTKHFCAMSAMAMAKCRYVNRFPGTTEEPTNCSRTSTGISRMRATSRNVAKAVALGQSSGVTSKSVSTCKNAPCLCPTTSVLARF
mmetsp:Transcript_19916/g.42501  ORF Transcript_19916/g.42501 Transcript_19916/m.42501 type:complete len:205 (+) Transcript_19916:358-972(+)